MTLSALFSCYPFGEKFNVGVNGVTCLLECRRLILQNKATTGGALDRHTSETSVLMREFDELITQLEKVRDTVWAKNKERGFETVTEFVLCFADVFGHSKSFTLLSDVSAT